MAEKEN